MGLSERVFSGASHLALWASLYVTGATVCFWQLSGLAPATGQPESGFGLLCAFFTAAAVYLLDRVKLKDAWLDPADREAHPDRYSFIASRSMAVRALLVICVVASAVTGYLVTPWAPVLTAAA